MSEDLDKLDKLNREWSFLTGVGYCYMPEDDTLEAKITALVKNQLETWNRIDTLRTHIIDLDRRLRLHEKPKKWWNG